MDGSPRSGDRRKVPASGLETVTGSIYSEREIESCLDPLFSLLLERSRPGKTVIVGIQGGQGTGKTTLAAYLSGRLAEIGCSVVSFSLDDYYAGFEERKRLAGRHPGNPFYRLPRGLPGTHRTEELHAALAALKAGRDVNLPVFDKSARGGEGDISRDKKKVRGRQDLVLFEGWCLGLPEASPEELEKIIRRYRLPAALEPPAREDYLAVLSRARPYRELRVLLDLLVSLQPDSPDRHEEWRLAQERELAARAGARLPEDRIREMVRLFLPFTYLAYEKLVPDLRIQIDCRHRFRRLIAGPGKIVRPERRAEKA